MFADPAVFWAKSEPEPNSGCWLWLGARSGEGYGQIVRREDGQRREHKAHRVAYRLATGHEPGASVVMHRCDNPPCVNPAHLRCGTVGDNNADRDAKGRGFKPQRERHGRAKLSESDVVAIRAASALGATRSGLGREYGVSRTAIHWIVKGRNWPCS